MLSKESIVLLRVIILVHSFGVSQSTGNFGREFFIGILKTYSNTYDEFSLLVTSNMTGTATIYIPHLGINATRSFNQSLEYQVTGDTITKVNKTVEKKGIHVTTDVDVTLTVMKYPSNTWEGFLALPTTMLSTEYVISSYISYDSDYYSDFLVLAVNDNSSIELDTGKSVFQVKLNKLETYLVRRHEDLSGTLVSSNKPVAVFTGHEASIIPKKCPAGGEFFVEQLLPTKHFAQEFIVPPLPPKSQFVVRIYNSVQNTSFTYRNSTDKNMQLLLKTGTFHEILSGADPMHIVTNKPVQVMLYSPCYNDANIGNGFMSTVPAISQFRSSYHFTVIKSFEQFINYLAVISNAEYISGLRINGHQMGTIFNSYMTHAKNMTFTVNIYNLTSGVYHLSHMTGKKFGAIQYGFYSNHAYGYPLGMEIAKVSLVKEKNESDGLKCFDCKDMTHLYLCDTVTKCSNDQVCYLETYRTNSGQVKYNSGCLASKECSSKKRQIGQTSSKCVQCCSSPLCNSKGCGADGLPVPSLRGPLCYDCSYVSSMDECTKVTLCAKDEVCSIEKYDWGGLYDQYITKCHNKQCIFHKREADHYVAFTRKSRSTPICKSCCNADLCNSNCTMTSQNGTDVIIVG